MSKITTHVLDTAKGKPAAGVQVVLERQESRSWLKLGSTKTGQDGRALLSDGHPLKAGIYRLSFSTAEYFASCALNSFYPFISVAFEIQNPAEHYHVPLLLNPFGYSTYRGS